MSKLVKGRGYITDALIHDRGTLHSTRCEQTTVYHALYNISHRRLVHPRVKGHHRIECETLVTQYELLWPLKAQPINHDGRHSGV